jgi:outer membrane protein
MKYIKLIFLLLTISSFAQETKVGTIDIDFVLSKMPEIKGVDQQVQDYKKGLETELQKKIDDFQRKVNAYKAEEADLTINQKKMRQDSLVNLESDINKFQQNGNQLIVLKQEEFMQPLYTTVGNALEKIAQAGGYTQVLLRDNSVVYVDNRFDLTLAVLKELGIEVKPNEE